MTTWMRELALVSTLVHDDPTDVYMSSRAWSLGPVQVVHTQSSGFVTDVTHDRDDMPLEIAIMLGPRAGGMREQFGDVVRVRPGGLDLVELNRPHRSWVRRTNDGWCVKVPVESLALPARTVSRARTGLATSPVHGLFAQHLRTLARNAAELAADAVAAPDVGAATVALTRALLSTAGQDDASSREALHDALVIRIRGFVRRHLRDPDLSAERIAAAHHISVRYLYRTLAEAGIQLNRSIIDQRLDGARWELATPGGRHRTVAAVAHRWGFSSPAHFSQRFKERYGMTPTEWQRLAPRH